MARFKRADELAGEQATDRQVQGEALISILKALETVHEMLITVINLQSAALNFVKKPPPPLMQPPEPSSDDYVRNEMLMTELEDADADLDDIDEPRSVALSPSKDDFKEPDATKPAAKAE